MIGPRNTVVRTMLGEDVPLEEVLVDESEWVNSDIWLHMPWHESPPEFWAHLVRDHVAEELADA
jgi:hypothetical protein